MTEVETLMTVDEFEQLPDDEWRTELVRGRLVREPPAGMNHGELAIEVAFRMMDFVRSHDLGKVYAAETGFVLFENPPTVRAPDVAFVAKSRLPSPEESIRFGRMAPDLAVEVVSPSSTASEILDKVADYLKAGTRLLWVVEPRWQCVTEYRSRTEIRQLQEDDLLDGYDVLPGFSVPVAELFAHSTTG